MGVARRRRRGARTDVGAGLVNRYRATVFASHQAQRRHELACPKHVQPGLDQCAAPELWMANQAATDERTEAYRVLQAAGLRAPFVPYPWQRPDPLTDEVLAMFARLVGDEDIE